MKSVVILGSTGSVGASVLDVIRRHLDKYRIVGLAAHRDFAAMARQCAEFAPQTAVMADETSACALADELPKSCKVKVRGGDAALTELANDADIVVCAIVGAAGLKSTLAAVRGGKKVLIANKEPLVMLGQMIVNEARKHGATLIPLDSEHNAIFQCLPHGVIANHSAGHSAGHNAGHDADRAIPGLRRIWLTASGGPFRNLPAAKFGAVTPTQACAHPNWQMGQKISVDSATMMNKGLELIEACALFSVAAENIEIVIHPQSVIHSMVEYIDGSMLAQLGCPDMRVSIASALSWPHRIDSGARMLNILECARLDFEAPDAARFPALRLARTAIRHGGVMPCVMNAANEVAVESFLSGGLRFDKIALLVERTMTQFTAQFDAAFDAAPDLDGVLTADRRARQIGRGLLNTC